MAEEGGFVRFRDQRRGIIGFGDGGHAGRRYLHGQLANREKIRDLRGRGRSAGIPSAAKDLPLVTNRKSHRDRPSMPRAEFLMSYRRGCGKIGLLENWCPARTQDTAAVDLGYEY
jgi:hypothetical protein